MPNTEETHAPAPELVADRVGTRTYIARNERGAQVRIGSPGDPASFTPGELLKLAVSTCAALSADHTLASLLGDEFVAQARVVGVADEADERYTRIDATLVADMSALDPQRHEALKARAHKAIERQCTVGRTLAHGADYTAQVENGSV